MHVKQVAHMCKNASNGLDFKCNQYITHLHYLQYSRSDYPECQNIE